MSRELLMVTALQKNAANAAAVTAAGPYAANTFSVEYVTDLKASYFVACWQMTATQKAAFEKAMAAQIGAKTVELAAVTTKQTAQKTLTTKKLSPVAKTAIIIADK